MAYSTTIAAIIANSAGWETTLEREYAGYDEMQRRFVDLMVMRRSAALNNTAEVVTAANTITADENGKTFYLHNTTGFDSVLPVAALGLNFRFYLKTQNTSGNHTITAATADTIIGTVHESSGGDGDSDQAADRIEFVASTALPGDMVELNSDGVSWFAHCYCDAPGAIILTG